MSERFEELEAEYQRLGSTLPSRLKAAKGRGDECAWHPAMPALWPAGRATRPRSGHSPCPAAPIEVN